jgi:hypothetical protein
MYKTAKRKSTQRLRPLFRMFVAKRMESVHICYKTRAVFFLKD